MRRRNVEEEEEEEERDEEEEEEELERKMGGKSRGIGVANKRTGWSKRGRKKEKGGTRRYLGVACATTRRENEREESGAGACVEDVWLAVQRRRPGVPRRSFGISLTPPLIISLFLPDSASFVVESGMHLTSRGASSSRRLSTVYPRADRRMCVHTRTKWLRWCVFFNSGKMRAASGTNTHTNTWRRAENCLSTRSCKHGDGMNWKNIITEQIGVPSK